MKDIILKTAKQFQKTIEQINGGNPVGTCYLIGYCLTEIFKAQGFESRMVTGTQALLIKNSKDKYIKYGNINLKGVKVGYYHTWCEVDFDGSTYIVDASLKYNTVGVKQMFNLKTDLNITGILITNTPDTYYYKYKEDSALEMLSLSYLNKTSKSVLNQVIQETLIAVGSLTYVNCA
jgi:hypothetical protein